MIVITTMDAIPECCYECPCSNGESGYCQIDKERRYSDYRPYWCPLKDIPNEQEAVEPVTESSVYDPDTWFFVCGSCKKSVINSGDKFCRWCGRAVKWE